MLDLDFRTITYFKVCSVNNKFLSCNLIIDLSSSSRHVSVVLELLSVLLECISLVRLLLIVDNYRLLMLIIRNILLS